MILCLRKEFQGDVFYSELYVVFSLVGIVCSVETYY